MSKEWNLYKEYIAQHRAIILQEQKILWKMLEECKCEENVPRTNTSYDHANKKTFITYFDECPMCLKIHNVRTEKIGPRQEHTKRNQKRRH